MSSSITTDTTDSTEKSPSSSPKTDRAIARVKWSVFWGWAALAGLVLYAEWHFWMRSLHPPFLPVGLLLATMVGSVPCLLWNTVRLLRKRTAFALMALIVGLAPVGLLAWPLAYAASQWGGRNAPANRFRNFATIFGASMMDAEVRRRYPHRLESSRLVMFYGDSVTAPKEDLAAMEAHVATIEASFGRRLREKIWWVRGPVFGQSGVSFLGLSLGSEQSPATETSLDRHELAHAVIEQFRTAEFDPPSLLNEGWAEAYSGFTDQELAQRALSERQLHPTLTVRELVSEEWYHRHDGAVYWIGGGFCKYLLKRFGNRTFLDLYVRSRPGRVVQSAPLILGVGFDTLERDFWREMERSGKAKP